MESGAAALLFGVCVLKIYKMATDKSHLKSTMPKFYYKETLAKNTVIYHGDYAEQTHLAANTTRDGDLSLVVEPGSGVLVLTGASTRQRIQVAGVTAATVSLDGTRICILDSDSLRLYERPPSAVDFVPVKAWQVSGGGQLTSFEKGCIYRGRYYSPSGVRNLESGSNSFASNETLVLFESGALYGVHRQDLSHEGTPHVGANGKVITLGPHVYSLESSGYAYLQTLDAPVAAISNNGSHLFTVDGRVFTHP